MIRMAVEPDADWVDTLDDDDALLTGEAVALDLRPAGFALRAGGAAIDFVVSIVAFVALLLAFFTPAGWIGLEAAWATVFLIASLVLAFVVAALPGRDAEQGQVARTARGRVPASCGTTAGPSASDTPRSAPWWASSTSC